jgi:hypothetical protein
MGGMAEEERQLTQQSIKSVEIWSLKGSNDIVGCGTALL